MEQPIYYGASWSKNSINYPKQSRYLIKIIQHTLIFIPIFNKLYVTIQNYFRNGIKKKINNINIFFSSSQTTSFKDFA